MTNHSKNNSLDLASKYKKDVGQIILAFEVQEGFIVLPKSVTPSRIASNLDIDDIKLTEEEMEAIRALDKGKGKHDPDAPGVGEYLLEHYKIHD
ncbi:aldo/keto reductase [Streptococcus uberis]|uniref:aldo/keto reductase n=1 Tax=Streptococcus uberis TaxID=1349 RepID=UPI003892BF3C